MEVTKKKHGQADNPAVMIAGAHSLFQTILCRYINAYTEYSAFFTGNNKLPSMNVIKSIDSLRAVFICYELQNCHGTDFARAIRAYNRNVAVIGFSQQCSETKVLRMLDAGAKAFLNYDCPEEDIGYAIESVIADCYYFNSCLTKQLYEHWLVIREQQDAHYKNGFNREESHIISLIHKGKKHEEIAKVTKKSKKSIDNAVSYLLSKTNKRNSHELVNYALKHDEIEM